MELVTSSWRNDSPAPVLLQAGGTIGNQQWHQEIGFTRDLFAIPVFERVTHAFGITERTLAMRLAAEMCVFPI